MSNLDINLLLDTVDYSFPNYTPSEQALEFFALMRLVQGKDFEFRTPMIHYFMIDAVFGKLSVENFPYSEEAKKHIRYNRKRIAIMASRGLAKSSVITTFLPVYCAIKGKMPGYGNVYFMLGIAASAQGGGRVISKSIESLCVDSKFCQSYFENMRFTETESEFTRKGDGSKDSRTFLFRTMGYMGGIRGTRSNVGSHRPDAILFDDTILNTQAAYSTTQMETLEEIIFSDAENALLGGGKGRLIHVFTPFHMADPNVKMITSKAYTPIVFPICERIDESTTKEEFKSAWIDMHPFNAVKSQYLQAKSSGKLQAFMQERMLRITSEEQRLIPDKYIQWYDNQLLYKILMGAKSNSLPYTILITTDFTASNSKSGDYSGIAVWAISPDDDWFLIDLFLEKCTIQEQYDTLFRLVQKYSIGGRMLEVGIEVDGQQKLNIHALKQMMIEKDVWFRFARQKGSSYNSEGITSRAAGGNKLERLKYTLPRFELNKIWFPEHLKDTPAMQELLQELRMVSFTGIGSTHDDGLDLISQLQMIDYVIPTANSNLTDKSFELDVGAKSIWGELPIDPDTAERNSLIF